MNKLIIIVVTVFLPLISNAQRVVTTETRVGDNSGTLTPDKIRLSSFITREPGQPISARVYVDSASMSSQAVRMAIYTDEEGRPLRLIAETYEHIILANTGSYWAEALFISRPYMWPGKYWIGVLASQSFAPARYRFYDVEGRNRYVTSNVYREGFYPTFFSFEDLIQGAVSAAITYRPIK